MIGAARRPGPAARAPGRTGPGVPLDEAPALAEADRRAPAARPGRGRARRGALARGSSRPRRRRDRSRARPCRPERRHAGRRRAQRSGAAGPACESAPASAAEPYRLELEGEPEAAAAGVDRARLPVRGRACAPRERPRGRAPSGAHETLQRLGARSRPRRRAARLLRERGARDLRRGPRALTRANPGASPGASSRCWSCSRTACETARSPTGSCCRRRPSTITCRRSSASSRSTPVPRPPPRRAAWGSSKIGSPSDVRRDASA